MGDEIGIFLSEFAYECIPYILTDVFKDVLNGSMLKIGDFLRRYPSRQIAEGIWGEQAAKIGPDAVSALKEVRALLGK